MSWRFAIESRRRTLHYLVPVARVPVNSAQACADLINGRLRGSAYRGAAPAFTQPKRGLRMAAKKKGKKKKAKKAKRAKK